MTTIGYVVIGLIAWLITIKVMMHRFAVAEIEKRESDRFIGNQRKNDPLTDGYDLALAATVGFTVGAFWPVCVPLGLITLITLKLTRGFEPAVERRYRQSLADAEELKQLRLLARREGLPMPGQDDAS